MEQKVKTELELCKLRNRLLKKNADYSKLFRLLSDNLHKVGKPTFLSHAASIPLNPEEADFLFNYLDYDERDGSFRGEVYYSMFLRKLAPSDTMDL